jgi:hypothetical protein
VNIGDSTNFNIHGDFLYKYLKSYALQGNGSSFEAPLHIYYSTEKFDFVDAMNFKRKSRKSVYNKNGRCFEIWTCLDSKNNEITLYFDITSYMHYLRTEFESGDKNPILF